MLSTIRLQHIPLMILLAIATQAAAAAPHIDHVIVGVSDLDQAVAKIEQLTGVRPQIGGSHPGRGTRNALLALGTQTYLELLAPDPAQDVHDADVEGLRKLTKPTVAGWAVSAGDADGLRRRAAAAGLKLTPWQPGSRKLPSGATLKWRTFGYAHYASETAPFFIAWTDPALHPARTSPAGCRYKSLVVSDPSPAQLRRALALLKVKVRVVAAKASAMRLRIACPAGEVTFG